jgi:restriction endonuclease S subunit
MKDITSNQLIDWQSCIETNLANKPNLDLLKIGDILFIARGSKNIATLVDESIADFQVVASPHFFIIRCLNSVSPDFVCWWLNQEPSQRYFQREAEGTLTKSIRRSVLENAPIAIPTLAKQQKIVALANTIKQEQALTEQLLRNGETLMSSIANDLLENTHLRNKQHEQ